MKFLILVLLFVLMLASYHSFTQTDKHGIKHRINIHNNGKLTDYNYKTHKTIYSFWK
jgi:hypothetical protein